MRWRCALLLGWLVLAAGAPLRADPAAARVLIKQCAQQAKPDLRGIIALREACPGIDTAIGDLGLQALLAPDWRKRLSPVALADLSALADQYAQQRPRALPSASSLRNIAQRLELPSQAPSWWERFKAWLASWLESDRGRWPDWLRHLPFWRSGARVFIFVSVALVIIAAVVTVAIELRAAGVLGARRRRDGATRGAVVRPSVVDAERCLGPADIDAAPEHLRPVILLRLLVTALTRTHRLERDGVLTCRELISAARFDTPAQRDIFASVALSAEQVLYGDPRRSSAPPSDDLLGNARGLYGQLAAAPAEQPAT